MALPNSNLLVSGSGAVFIQNLAVQGNSIVATNQDGNVEFVPNGSGVIAFGNVGFNNGLINTTVTNLDLVLSPDGTGNTLIAPYATGNVGIGTNNPSEMLDLMGSFKQQDTMTRFFRKTIPTVGSPFESLNGYILLGKAATTSGTNMPASYVVGKVIMRRGNTSEQNFVDVFNVMSSRGYDNETFSVNIEHAGTNTTRFSRLVKCTYESVEYHAIETTDAGGPNTYEQTFEGYSVDGGLLFVDETYVIGVVDYGSLGVVSNGDSNVGIGTVSTTAHFDIGTNDDGRIQAILTRGNDPDFQLQALNSSSSNASGAIVSKFGVRHGTNETALFHFIRGNLGNDGSLAIVTNNAEHVRVDSVGNVGIGTSVPAEKLDVNGTLRHKGLVLNEGTTPNVDEIKTFTKTLSISTSWSDTGITGLDLATGSYIVQVYDNHQDFNGLDHWSMYFTGFMTWYGGGTNSDNEYNEILLHNAGHDLNGDLIFIRTIMVPTPGYLKLQIRCSSGTGSGDFIFKFRRMI